MTVEHKHGPVYIANFATTWAANIVLLRRTNTTDNTWYAGNIAIRQTTTNNATQDIIVEVVNTAGTVVATQTVNLPANTTFHSVTLNMLPIARNHTLVVRGNTNNSPAPANVDIVLRLL